MADPLFVDIETSGLHPGEHVIFSVAAIFKDKEFLVHILPTWEEWERANKVALEVNGMTFAFLRFNGKPLKDATDQFITWLCESGVTSDDAFWVGQNPKFDLGFLAHFMRDELNFADVPGPNKVIDVRDLFVQAVRAGKAQRQTDLKGKTISLALGVEPEPDVHEAIEGARVVKRNYERLMELLKEE